MSQRPLLYDNQYTLAKAQNEKIDKGEYEIVTELSPDEIKEYESLIAVSDVNARAFDQAYRCYINHVSSNKLDLVSLFERLSRASRYEKNYDGLIVTRHNGRVVLARLKYEEEVDESVR